MMTKPQIKILLVEDTPADKTFLEVLLQRDPRVVYVVTAVDRLSQGLQKIHEEDFALILLDLGLPDSQGLDTVKQFREASLDLPVIVLSGLMDEELALQAVHLGAQDYIVKGTTGWDSLSRSIRYAIERKQTEQALLEGEARFRTLFENSPVAVWEEDFSQLKTYLTTLQKSVVRDLDTYLNQHSEVLFECIQLVEVKDVNRAALDMYEVGSKSDLVGSLKKTLPPESLESFKREIRAIAADETNFRSETSLRTAKGNLRNVALSWAAAPGFEQTYAKVLVSLTDITDRKQAEEKLRHSEEQYRFLFENNPLPMWAFDQETLAFLAVNDAAVEKYGYSHAEFLNMTLAEIRPPEDLERFRQRHRDPNSALYHSDEWRHKLKDGRIIDVEITSYKLTLHDRDAMLVVAQDITGRKQAEQKYQQIFENSLEGIFQSTPEGRFISVNPAMARIYGYASPQDMIETIGSDIAKHLYLDPKDRLAYLAQFTDSDVVEAYEKKNKRKDGSEIWTSTSARAVRNAAGEILYYEGFLQDISERKRAEQELKKRDDLLAEAQRIGRIGHIEWDSATHMLNCSDEVYEILELPQGMPLTQQSLTALASPEESARLHELDLKAFAEQKDLDYEFRIQLSGGRTRWLRQRAASSYGSDGKPVRIVGTLQDITEHKQAEMELKLSETRYRLATQATRDVIWEWSRPTQQLMWTENAQLVLGYAPEEIGPDETWWDEHIHPTDRERVVKKLNLLMDPSAGESSWTDEYRFQLKNGSYAYINDHAYIERGSDGQVIRMVGAMSDITENKLTEEALKNSERRFRALIENGLDYISLLDATGNLLWESPSSTSLLGFKFNEFVGHSIFELVHPDDQQWTFQQFSALAAQPGHSLTGVFRLRRSDGSWRWVEAIASNFLHDPSVNAVVINYRDITERKQAQDELQQRNADLALVNSLNEAVIHGQDFHNLMHLLSNGLMKNFACEGVNFYMLSNDGRSLALEHYLLAPETLTQLERLLGGTIPLVNIPVNEGGYFHKCLNSPDGLLIQNEAELSAWVREFLATMIARSASNNFDKTSLQAIYNSLQIKSVISVPLVSQGKTIGILNLSSSNVFIETDLERVLNLSRQLTAAIQRQQADERVRHSEDFLNSVQNALSAHIAILDQHGTIVRVNAAWRKFAEQNGYREPHYGIGANYLEICDSATGINAEKAGEVATAIRQILTGDKRQAWVEYSCHSPEEKRWFILRITKFSDGEQNWAVLAHENITDRKQAEETIRRSEAILAQAGTMAHLGAWEIEVSDPQNINSNPARWSEEVYRILGYEPGSVTASNELFFEHVHPDDRQKLSAAMQRAITNHEAYAVEHRILQPNGVERILDEHANLIHDRHGNLIQILGAVQDVTERKQIQESLKQTSEQFRILFEASPEAIVLIDPHADWPIVDCNEAACVMNGYTRTELIGHSIDLLTLAHRSDEGRSAYLDSIRNAGILRYDDLHRRKDGTIFPIEVSTSVIQFGNRELVLGLDRDITERKNAEQALRDSEALYRQAIEVADGVPYRETYFNNGLGIHYDFIGEGIQQITGYGPDEFSSPLWESLIEEAHLIEDLEEYSIDEGIRRVRAGEYPVWRCEYRIRARDGKTHWVLEAAIELRDEHGTSHGSIGMFQDITARKKVEEDLRLSAEENQAIINAVPDLLFRINQTGSIIDYHARDVDELYVGPEEFLGRSVLQVLPAEVSEPAMAAITEAITTGKVVAFDYEINLRGAAKFYENRIVPLSNNEVLSIIRDITDRRQAEQALKESEERYRNLVNQLPVIVYTDRLVEGIGVTQYISPQIESITGFSEKEWLAGGFEGWKNQIHPDDREGVIERYLSCLRSGEPFVSEYRLNTKAGRLIWLMDQFEIVLDEQNQPFSSHGILSDITERKQSEQALQESEERYRTLVDQLPVVVYIDKFADEVGLTQYVSPQIENMIGFTPTEWIEGGYDLWRNQLHPEDRERVLHQYHHCMETAEPFECEYRIHTKTGQVVWLHDQSQIVFNAQHQPLVAHGISYDITERKQSEDDRQRRLAEFEALYENGLAISKLLDPKLISNKVVEVLAEKLHWHHAAIRLLQAESNRLELVALNHPGLSESQLRQQIERLNSLISDSHKGLTGLAIQRHVPVRSGNLQADAGYVETYPGMRSGLYVPIMAGERVLGAISVESELENAFTVQDERLLSTLANQAAVAIENAQLYLIVQKELEERQQAEARLRESEQRYRTLFEDSPVAVWEEDFSELKKRLKTLQQRGQDIRAYFKEHPEALEEYAMLIKVLRVNRSAVQMYQAASADQLIDLTNQAQSQGEQEHNLEDFIAIAEGRLSNSWEGSDETLAQEKIEIVVSWSVTPGYEADYSKVILTTIDITERKRAEEALRQSEENYRRLTKELERHVDERTAEVQDLYNNAPCGYHSLDATGVITRINETELRWLGYAREEVLYQPFINFLTPDSRAIFKESFPTFKQKGEVRDLEFDLIRKEGSTIPIVVSATAVYDHQGNYVSSRSTLFDNTERRSALETLRLANAEMQRALRTKDEFLANMSHELRTPLNAILGLSESLLEQTAGDLNEKQRKYLTTINESGAHLLELINDILDLAKVEAGQIKLDPNKVDINNLCQASVRMIKQLAQKKQQTVEVSIEKHIGYVWADERRLKQMIVNLLSNAVKFTPEGGKLGLSAQLDDLESKLLLSVWDNGIGIREEDLPRLFKPFVQLDSSLSRETSGTGLGLALVAQMARLHGGSISVTSTPGQGSRFTIVLPWDPALTTETLEKLKITGRFPVIKSLSGKPKTILLVEDTDSVVMLVRDYLELSGYKVELARDGVAGVSKAIAVQPDLILMDVQMPGMNGFDATKRIRQEIPLRHTPIIALTALAMVNDRERCLEAGMNDYVSKPVNLRQLIKTIQSYLSSAGSGEAS